MSESMKDVTLEITPSEHLAMWIVRGQQGDWCDWVPQWAWEMYKERAKRVAMLLRDFGITDEVIQEHRTRGVK